MRSNEVARLKEAERIIVDLMVRAGLTVPEIDFEIVPADTMMAAMGYHGPVNYGHWTHGRDYERTRTIYEHLGAGIPFEVVWNFERPHALLVESNPLPLNILIIAHVVAHVDFFLNNVFCLHGRSLNNVAAAARAAEERFSRYEEQYGITAVEAVIDAGLALQWHQNPDPFFVENEDEEEVRKILIRQKRCKLAALDVASLKPAERQRQKDNIEWELDKLARKTPPEPTYDLLSYITNHSPKPLKPWEQDILKTIRGWARAVRPNSMSTLLNEGWATFWHSKIMHQLFEMKFLTPEEFGVWIEYHAKVAEKRLDTINPYFVGMSLFKYLEKKKQDTPRVLKKDRDGLVIPWTDTTVDVFRVRAEYSDVMAVETLFSDDFIREQELFIFMETVDDVTGERVFVVAETDPTIIRHVLKTSLTPPLPRISVQNGDARSKGQLFLKHHWTGFELDPAYCDRTIEKIYFLWGKPVLLMTQRNDRNILITCGSKGTQENAVDEDIEL